MVGIEYCLLEGLSLCLLLPLRGNDAKEDFVWALCLAILGGGLLLCKCKYYWLLFTIVGLFCHSYRHYRLRFRDKTNLRSYRTVWYAAQCESQLMSVIVFIILALMVIISETRIWLQCVLVGVLVAAYLMYLIRNRDACYLYMSRSDEKEIRRALGGRSKEQKKEDLISKPMRELYAKVERYMESTEAYLDKDFSLKDLAYALYTNRTYLSRTINCVTGENFRVFVNNYRIKYAVNMIKEQPNLRIDEIAEASGFSTRVTYSMAFKMVMGDSPGEYAIKVRSHLV